MFSTSLGHGLFAPADGLVFQPTTSTADEFSADGSSRVIARLDHSAEGLNFDGKLWVAHQSAADKYRGNVVDPHDAIQVHDVDDLHISRDEPGGESDRARNDLGGARCGHGDALAGVVARAS